MTRLLQVMAGQSHGGAEAFFERLAVALQKDGETQRLVIRRDPARAERLREAGCAVVEAPFGGKLDFRTAGALKGEIASFKPWVVLTWMSRASTMCPAGEFVHVGRLGGYYDLKYYRGCDHLVANTRDIVDYIVRGGWPEERVHYLPNFAEIADAAPIDRASLDTPADAPLALALGRLHRNKGFDVLLGAVARVPELYLWLAGEGEEHEALERRARELGVAQRVRFLGWREDVAALLATADVLVSSSRHEPLGNVVLEAWAARVPVVASASEGPSVLIEDGETGLLVPVEDEAALAAAVVRVIHDKDLAARLAERGHAQWQSQFSVAPVVAAYRQLLATVRR